MLRKNGILAFEDYEKHKTIIIYSHLIIAINVNLLKHQGRKKLKYFFNIINVDYKALLETLKQRDDVLGTLH